MKKSLLLFIAAGFMVLANNLNAQECTIYEGYKEGSSTKMVHYDKKDKVTGTTITTVKERKDIEDGVSLTFNQAYDDGDEYEFESEFTVECQNGEVNVDMSKMLDPNTMTAYENMEFEIEADDLSIPPKARAGDKLDDGEITVTVITGTPVNVSITVGMSNRKVESEEKIETPAGKFDCLKIAYDLETKIGFLKVKSSTVEYYNKKHGVIKSESYNKRGKLTGYSIVEEINY